MFDVYDATWGTSKVWRAERSRHFANLFLIEIEACPADAEIDWIDITQATPNQPKSSWQVPWDERKLEYHHARWAFFMHYLNPNAPLLTPVGPVSLPPATPTPRHLENIRYELPG
jgi:hypothetical protein